MLAYYISQSNEYTFRTEPTASNSFTMSLQDMTTQYNLTASISGLTYEPYESYVSFTMSNISGAIVGEEYRAVLSNSTASGSVDIWNGTIQVYASQSIDKSVYENQNTQYISNESENRYIIMD
jgi:hypothetical protein